MLNETIKKQLLNKAETIDIDVSELESYHWDNNPYDLEPALACGSACGVWDEDEEWEEKIKKLVYYIQSDGVGEYCKLSDNEHEKDNQDKELSHQAINWLNSLLGE